MMNKRKMFACVLSAVLCLSTLPAYAAVSGNAAPSGDAVQAGEALPAGEDRMEGEGADTPEDAVKIYLDGLAANDIDQMLSAFAVESYTENYSLAKEVEQLSAYTPAMKNLPPVSDFSRRINNETRRAQIMEWIRCHYLVITGSKAMDEENLGRPVPIKDTYDSGDDFVADYFAADDSGILGSVRFNGEYYEPSEITEYYEGEQFQNSLKKRAESIGAEDIKSVAAVFYVSGAPVLLFADAVSYHGKWYICTVGGNLSVLMNIQSALCGMVPMSTLEGEG